MYSHIYKYDPSTRPQIAILRHPGGTQEAPRRHPGLQRPLRENIATPLSYNAKVPLNVQFHEGVLRVTSILTAYLQ